MPQRSPPSGRRPTRRLRSFYGSPIGSRPRRPSALCHHGGGWRAERTTGRRKDVPEILAFTVTPWVLKDPHTEFGAADPATLPPPSPLGCVVGVKSAEILRYYSTNDPRF